MKKNQKNLLKQLLLLSLISFTGCATKDANGKYNTHVYSYHNQNQQREAHLGQNIRTPQRSSRPQNQASRPTLRGNQANNIERVAKSLLGTDYQFGANGPFQYDCSSFTKYVFSRQGIKLPRVSRDQAETGEYIRRTQLQKGDLIFFDSKKSTKVSHVGIYLGRGAFIHASSAKDKVVISSLNSSYYTQHFKWGRRVTQENFRYAKR